MASRAPVSSSLALILALVSCKVPEAQSPSPPGAPSEPGAPSSTSTPPSSGETPTTPSGDGAPASSAAPSGAPAPGIAPPASNERPGPPLPELRVKSFGLHVGGASKDTELRREVQRTLERGFPRYLDCYRLVDEPGSEGTFGADIHVGADGGKAKASQPRTKLKGEAFRACMVKAFESANFDAPSSGRAIVVSYSIKFSFDR